MAYSLLAAAIAFNKKTLYQETLGFWLSGVTGMDFKIKINGKAKSQKVQLKYIFNQNSRE